LTERRYRSERLRERPGCVLGRHLYQASTLFVEGEAQARPDESGDAHGRWGLYAHVGVEEDPLHPPRSKGHHGRDPATDHRDRGETGVLRVEALGYRGGLGEQRGYAE